MDASVFAHIQRRAAEEHGLFERRSLEERERKRLAAIQVELDQCWDLRASGAQLAKLQELVRYWGSKYDRRKGEAKLNAFPQFKTRIDGIDCSLTKPNF